MPVNQDRRRVYLKSAQIKGFKSIEDLSVDFKKGLNILIGKNGAGKSNLIEVLTKAMKYKRNNRLFFNYANLCFDLNSEHLFVLELTKNPHITISRSAFDDEMLVDERLLFDDKILYNNTSNENPIEGIEFEGRRIFFKGSLRALFSRIGFAYPDPYIIHFSLPQNLECIDIPGTLQFIFDSPAFGSTYPKTLDFIEEILSHFESFFENDHFKLKDLSVKKINKILKIPPIILQNLKSFSPIERIRFNQNVNPYLVDKTIVIENIKIEFQINNAWLPWSQLSDGTKRLFYIITEVTYANGLVLIEEPELGVHPHQFNLLMDFLKEQAQEKQIIISTHSPKALDHLSPDELGNILIAYYDKDKGTQTRHLTEKEEKKAKKYMKEVGFFSDYWMLSDLE